MMTAALKVFTREWYLVRSTPSQWTQPWVFIVLMTLLPGMLIGDQLRHNPLLPGMLIILSIVYACMLSLDRAIRQENLSGIFAQWLISPWPMWWLMLVKGWSHWLLWVMPMVFISPVMMVVFGLDLQTSCTLFIALSIATPMLSFVGLMSSALTLNAQASGFLVALIMLPLIMPMALLSLSPIQSVLIDQSPAASFALLAAITVVSSVLCPIACAFGVRVGQSCGNF